MEEVEELAGHDDGIISLAFADRMLYSGSYDHSIRSWDIKEMMQRISERELMSFEDIESKKYEVYYNVVFKNKKKKLPAKKKKWSTALFIRAIGNTLFEYYYAYRQWLKLKKARTVRQLHQVGTAQGNF